MILLSKLDEIRFNSHMNIKSGHVMISVEDRDWLIKTIEEQQIEIEKLQKNRVLKSN